MLDPDEPNTTHLDREEGLVSAPYRCNEKKQSKKNKEKVVSNLKISSRNTNKTRICFDSHRCQDSQVPEGMLCRIAGGETRKYCLIQKCQIN